MNVQYNGGLHVTKRQISFHENKAKHFNRLFDLTLFNLLNMLLFVRTELETACGIINQAMVLIFVIVDNLQK